MEFCDKFYSPNVDKKTNKKRRDELPPRDVTTPLFYCSPTKWQFGGDCDSYPRDLRCVNGPLGSSDPRLQKPRGVVARTLGALCHGLATFRRLNDRPLGEHDNGCTVGLLDVCLLARSCAVTLIEDLRDAIRAVVSDVDVRCGLKTPGLPQVDALLDEVWRFGKRYLRLTAATRKALEARSRRRQQALKFFEEEDDAVKVRKDEFSWSRYGSNNDGDAAALPRDEEEEVKEDTVVVASRSDERKPAAAVVAEETQDEPLLLERTVTGIEILVRVLVFLETELEAPAAPRTIEDTIAAVRDLEDKAPWRGVNNFTLS
mmetsp:Transcript_20391/g.63047  ORF Transcript_20391/g.63047 Transcript_20391/m.63047 type:complete len:316 (+) Transcript_20391:851-1798(+)